MNGDDISLTPDGMESALHIIRAHRLWERYLAERTGFSYGDKQYKIVDLPGTYSLLSTSLDEEVPRDFILFGQPDVTVIVVDATRLERNLNLVLRHCFMQVAGRC